MGTYTRTIKIVINKNPTDKKSHPNGNNNKNSIKRVGYWEASLGCTKQSTIPNGSQKILKS